MYLKSRWTKYKDSDGAIHHRFEVGALKIAEVIDDGNPNDTLTLVFNFRKFVFDKSGGEELWKLKVESKVIDLIDELYNDTFDTLVNDFEYRKGVYDRKQERLDEAKRRASMFNGKSSVEVPPESDFLNLLESIIKGGRR